MVGSYKVVSPAYTRIHTSSTVYLVEFLSTSYVSLPLFKIYMIRLGDEKVALSIRKSQRKHHQHNNKEKWEA